MRTLLPILVFLLLVTCGCCAQQENPRVQPRELPSFTLPLETRWAEPCKSGGISLTALGTSTLLTESQDGYPLVLTASHVIKSELLEKTLNLVPTSKVTFPEEDSIPAEIVLIGERSDAALLKLDTKRRFSYPELATRDPIVGEDIFIIGNPSGFSKILISAKVAGICGINSQCGSNIPHREYLTDRPIYHGMSGGSVFRKNGELIGIAIEVISLPFDSLGRPLAPTEVPAFGIFVGVRPIRELLQRQRKERR